MRISKHTPRHRIRRIHTAAGSVTLSGIRRAILPTLYYSNHKAKQGGCGGLPTFGQRTCRPRNLARRWRSTVTSMLL